MSLHPRWQQNMLRIRQLMADPSTCEEAVKVAREALVVAELEFAANDEHVLAAVNMLGLALRHVDQFEASQAAFLRCLELHTSQGQEPNMDVAVIMSNLGSLALAQEQWELAKTHYEQALALKRALLGDHASVASSLCDLGLVADEQGQLELAMDRYLEAFEMFCRVDAAGRWPQPVLMAVVNSARKLMADGQHEAALRGFSALRGRLKPPGVDPFIVQCARALGRDDELAALGIAVEAREDDA